MVSDAIGVVGRLERTAWWSVPSELALRTASTVAAVHGLTPLPQPEDVDAPTWPAVAEAPALAFAEQFAIDVSVMSDPTRQAMLDALGANAFTYVQTVYVFDVIGRARALLTALDATPPAATDDEPFSDLWTGIETFLNVVPGLDALDAVTTELVRLRLARHHNCRLCKSLRSYSALAAGSTADALGAVVTGTERNLDEATRAALELVDVFAWTPQRLATQLRDELRRDFTDAQLVEIVLDTARNAANKIAVALGADAPHVTDGFEVYDVATDGTVTYGLTFP
jgi:AhpD family alkylhydroperoxidase